MVVPGGYLIDYVAANVGLSAAVMAFWVLGTILSGFPKSQIIADVFAFAVVPCGIAVFMGQMNELLLMTSAVAYMFATIVPYSIKGQFDMVGHHVFTVVMIVMGCSSEQALEQKFMTLTLGVELSAPFLSYWQRNKKGRQGKTRMFLALASFFFVRIACFGAYAAYLVWLATVPNKRFDQRPLHLGIAMAHILLFFLFVWWFQKQLKIYRHYKLS